MKGKYEITDMPDFDSVYLGIEVDPFINLFDGGGHFKFGLVEGFLEYMYSKAPSKIEFEWRGSDEMDEVYGSGTINLISKNEISGFFVFNNDEKFSFNASKL